MEHKIELKKIFFLIIGCAVLFLSFLLFAHLMNQYQYNRQKDADLEQLTSSSYEGIFCSMYPIDNYLSEDFATYRGIEVLTLNTSLRSTEDVSEYLSAAFTSNNRVTHIYLGLDPAQIWESSHKDIAIWNRSLSENILSYSSAHPEVTFEILLPSPSLEYWLDKSEKETEEILTNYHSLVSTLAQQANVITFFAGNQEWLIANSDNYSEALSTNDIVSQHLMLSAFCDRNYVITVENASAQIDTLKEIIQRERTSPTEYADLSDMDIVFFGDSIIGNYTGSYSVPGIVSALSNAQTYNCAQGGIPASVDPNAPLSFPSSVDYFIAQDASRLPANGPFPDSLEKYATTDHTGQNLCFILNFGLNDYFFGLPVSNPDDPYDDTSYAGALRTGISKLQRAYPDATILLTAPNPIVLYENGTLPLSEKGGVLTEYVDTALQVANEMNVLCLNNYTDLGIRNDNAWTYLADGTHLNETGRFLLAQHIIYKIALQD